MESRLRKTKINLFWQLVYQIVTLVLGLIVPHLIINTYGSEVNGLTSTVKHIVTLVTLAKAGISTAVTFSLYKPVNENNRVKIQSTLLAVKKVFGKVGVIVAVVGLVASVLISFLQSGSILPIYIFSACFLMCIYTAVDLAFTASYNVYFSATQERYVISIGLLIWGILTYGLEILIVLLKAPFILLYFCSVVACIVKIVFLKLCFKKSSKRFELKEGEVLSKEKISMFQVGYATVNEVAHSVVVASQTIIISLLYSLNEASVYSIYAMVINALSLVAQVFNSAFSPSYGSVMAEGNHEKINRVFNIFQFSFMSLNTFMYMCTVPLLVPFVEVYTSGVNDIEYINPLMAVLFIMYGLFYAFRIPYNISVSASGLFRESGLQTGITAAVCLVLSVLLGIIDYTYVLIGLVLFYFVNVFYQHFMLKKKLEWFNNRGFWIHLTVTVLGVATMVCLNELVKKAVVIQTFFQWIIYALIVSVIAFLILGLLMLIFERKHLKDTLRYFKNKMRR